MKTMVELKTFTNDDLPEAYAHQIRDFVRIHWFDGYKFSSQPPVSPDELSPVYCVMAEDQALYSSATVVRRLIQHDGIEYMCYGLSSVLTYPYFRKRGYGSQVVEAATDRIKQAPDADIAWLQTGPKLEGFYRRFGWEHTPQLQILSGDPSQPSVEEDAFSMLLYVSDKAKMQRSILERASLYLGSYLW
jgi:predicted acetyltransferase